MTTSKEEKKQKEALALLERILKMKRGDKRLSKCLRNPEEEYTDDWFICIPKCFNDSLDIKYTERKKAGKTYFEWTQGSAFTFKAGNILYDTSKAYEHWSEALGHMEHCIQIIEAFEAIPEEKKSAKNQGTIRNPGIVRFHTFVPNKNRSRLIKHREKTMTQDEFVHFLIAGPSAVPKDLFE